MKYVDMQQLAVGTKVYQVEFEVSAWLGEVIAGVFECETRIIEYHHGIFRFVRNRWEYVKCKNCFLDKAEADRELASRMRKLRDALIKACIDIGVDEVQSCS